jgi:hypothetical protein
MSKNKTRKRLLTIVAWFFIPLAMAVAWYGLLPAGYRPSSMTNNGELLDPVFSLETFDQQVVNGETFSGKDVETVWTLVHFIQGQCDARCSESLYNTRQMRLSFGKEIERIQRISVLKDGQNDPSNLKMWASHPDMRVLIAAKGGIGSQIETKVKGFDWDSNAVFLLDPLGNVVMRFRASLELKLVKKDIKKLLKLSRIG